MIAFFMVVADYAGHSKGDGIEVQHIWNVIDSRKTDAGINDVD